MSTRLGSNTKPASTQEWTGLNTLNQQAHLLTMPSGGPWKVSRLGGWLAGKDADVTAYLCIWSAAGTLLARSAAFTAGGLAFALGNSTQYELDLTAPIQVAGSAQVYVGWSRNPAGAAQWGRTASGTHYDDTQTGSYPGSLSGLQADGGGDIAAWLYYDPWNTAPNAPTLTGPANGATVATTTPTLTFTHSDPNGDACASYDLQVDATSGNGVVPDWASMAVNVNDGTSGIAGNNVTYTCPALTRGQWYAWRAATKDPGGLQGAWSAPRYFLVNSLPTVTKVSPAAGNLAYIHNLGSDLAVWTSGGAHARPRLSWTFSDPQGGAQYAYQARLYDAGGSQLWDSGKVVSAALYVDVPYALVMGTTYQWSIAVWDQSNEKDAGGEAKSTFRVRWGQAIYEYSAGTGSSAWTFSSGNVPANTSKALLFATATGSGGAGRSAWTASIGALNPANGPYLNVLVRLATQASGTQPSLPDMTFRYIGASILPDHWDTQPPADWGLDTDTRRYGTQSLKVAVSTASNNRYAYPYTLASGDDIAVQPNTEYTLSAFVKTNGALKAGAEARLAIYNAGDLITERSDLYLDATHRATTDSNVADQDGKVWPEGWQRLRLTFHTDAQQDRLRPMLHYRHNGADAGDVLWWDAVKLEEGTVATAWTPGFVGDPVVLDAGGVAVDASAGGIFRLRSASQTKSVELADLAILGGLGSAPLKPTDLSADQDDYNPSGFHGAAVLILTATAPVTISGFDAGVEGELKFVRSVGGSVPYLIRFTHEDSASAAANRFAMPNDRGVMLWQGGWALFRYGVMDGTNSRWSLVATSQPTIGQPFVVFPPGIHYGVASNATGTLGIVSAGLGGAFQHQLYVPANMNLRKMAFYNTDADSLARSAEWSLFTRTNQSGSYTKVPGVYGTLSWTASAAGWVESPDLSPTVDIPPGAYWLMLRNTSSTAGRTIGFGEAATSTGTLENITRAAQVAALGNSTGLITAASQRALLVALIGNV